MTAVAPVPLPPGLLHGGAGADGETFDGPVDDAICRLFERHAAAAWGVAYAVVRNREDASDAVGEAYAKILGGGTSLAPRTFRSYFLRVVHNAAVDIQRRSQRVTPGDVEDQAAPDRGGPVDSLLAEEDRAIVASAFAQLPDRWREALWLIDVEGLSMREAGSVLGVSAANAAQLATRARARLRETYMQAHVPNHVRPGCNGAVEALGRYAAGTLSSRRRAEVERHVAGCAECSARLRELDDLGIKLRRAIPPLPVGLGLGARGRAQALFDVFSSHAGPVVAQATTAVGGGAPIIERIAAGATAAVLVVGLSSLAVRGADHPATDPSADPDAVATREVAADPASTPPAPRTPGSPALAPAGSTPLLGALAPGFPLGAVGSATSPAGVPVPTGATGPTSGEGAGAPSAVPTPAGGGPALNLPRVDLDVSALPTLALPPVDLKPATSSLLAPSDSPSPGPGVAPPAASSDPPPLAPALPAVLPSLPTTSPLTGLGALGGLGGSAPAPSLSQYAAGPPAPASRGALLDALTPTLPTSLPTGLPPLLGELPAPALTSP